MPFRKPTGNGRCARGKTEMMKKILTILLVSLAALSLAACSEYRKSYEDGRALSAQGNYEEAIRKYRLAISQGMQEPVVYADLAAALQYTGAETEADEAIEKALELGGEDPATLKKAGVFYLMRAQDATALRCLQQSVTSEEEELSAEDRDTMGYIADIYRRAGVYEEAIRIYNLLISQGFCTLEHEILAGSCYLGLMQHEAACQYFEMAANHPRITAKHYALIVRMLREAGAVVNAESFYARGLQFIEENGGMSRGSFVYRCGNPSEAAALLSESDDEETMLIRASVLRNQGDYDAAERIYEELIRNGHDGGNVYNAYMMLKTEAGDYTAARQLLQKVQASEDPEVLADAAWNEAILYERMQDYSGARDRLRAYASGRMLTESERRELWFLTGE